MLTRQACCFHMVLVLRGHSHGMPAYVESQARIAISFLLQEHYYQPMFTLVGSGHKTFAQTHQPMGQTLPKGATWVKDKAQSITPEQNLVTTANGVEVMDHVMLF